ERAGRRLDVRARAAGRGRRPRPVAGTATPGEPRRLMGAALRLENRHDTVAPPAPRVRAPHRPRALPRAAAGVLAAAALYTLACPPHEWSLLAWLVPGLLLVAVRGLATVSALACGALFGVAIGYGITAWAYHAALAYFAFNRARSEEHTSELQSR